MLSSSFSQIPANLRVPGTFLEIDPSLAESGVGQFPLRGVLIAQKIEAGTLAVNTPQRITSAEQASELAGPGSQASRMAAAWFSVNRSSPLDLVLLNDAGSGVAKTHTVDFSGAAAPGGVAFYVGGTRYLIDSSGSLESVAQALVDAINSDPEACVVASVNGGTPTQAILISKNAGAATDEIDVRHSHLDGESPPNGLLIAIAIANAGAGNPDITSALAAVSAVDYDIFIHPFTDASNLGILEIELLARADAMAGAQAHAITGETGTQGTLAALGDARNSEFSTVIGMESFPGVASERAAAIAGLVAFHGSINPARPFQTLSVPGYAASVESRFTLEERNLLLFDGISTTKVTSTNQVQIEFLITTYQENAAGAPSSAFLTVNGQLALSFYRKSYRAWIDRVFPRHSLADDGGIAPGPGSKIATPSSIKGSSIAHYQGMIAAGICEDLDGFIANSKVERDPEDPERTNSVLAPNFRNGLRVRAVLVQFRR